MIYLEINKQTQKSESSGRMESRKRYFKNRNQLQLITVAKFCTYKINIPHHFSIPQSSKTNINPDLNEIHPPFLLSPPPKTFVSSSSSPSPNSASRAPPPHQTPSHHPSSSSSPHTTTSTPQTYPSTTPYIPPS